MGPCWGHQRGQNRTRKTAWTWFRMDLGAKVNKPVKVISSNSRWAGWVEVIIRRKREFHNLPTPTKTRHLTRTIIITRGAVVRVVTRTLRQLKIEKVTRKVGGQTTIHTTTKIEQEKTTHRQMFLKATKMRQIMQTLAQMARNLGLSISGLPRRRPLTQCWQDSWPKIWVDKMAKIRQRPVPNLWWTRTIRTSNRIWVWSRATLRRWFRLWSRAKVIKKTWHKSYLMKKLAKRGGQILPIKMTQKCSLPLPPLRNPKLLQRCLCQLRVFRYRKKPKNLPDRLQIIRLRTRQPRLIFSHKRRKLLNSNPTAPRSNRWLLLRQQVQSKILVYPRHKILRLQTEEVQMTQTCQLSKRWAPKVPISSQWLQRFPKCPPNQLKPRYQPHLQLKCHFNSKLPLK